MSEFTRVSTTTKTYTRLEAIASQFVISAMYTNLLNDSQLDRLERAVNDKEIMALAVYAVKDGKNVAEVQLKVDWDKNQAITSIYGEDIDKNIPGFDYKNLEAKETKYFVRSLIENAEKNSYIIKMWVMPNEAKFDNKQERQKLLEEIGFTGGKPEEKIDDSASSSVAIEGLEELKVIYYRGSDK